MARSFNGSTDFIDTTLIYNTVTNSGDSTQPFSLSAWVMSSAGHGSFPTIFCPQTGGGGGQFLFLGYNNGSFPGFNIYYCGGETKNNTAPSNDIWYSVLATYNGNSTSGLKIYVNGIDVTVGQQGTCAPSASTIRMLIGNGTFAGNSFWKGNIADMAVWNVALTAGEASGLAAGMRPFQVRQKSLIGYWPIDGIQSPEPDLSGFVNNGTLTGTAQTDGPPMTFFTPRWPINTAAAAAATGGLGALLSSERSRIVGAGLVLS